MADVLDLHPNQEEAIGGDRAIVFPPQGMACPVPSCGDHIFNSYPGLMKHWKKRHTASIRVHKCPRCPKEDPRRTHITQHLLRHHHVPMNNLREAQLGVTTEVKSNKQFISPGDILPPRKSQDAAVPILEPVGAMDLDQAMDFYGLDL
ncbi:hypothetical protein FSP39_017191 [Pinctada imbricata]|uniref:C2H2-type domain-containing protein n=1 Tax=Pinctada imbricata TaxID=66713 RepID=A0AA88YHN7_PINIB|nr:hypothetical protein FSP39_017191 [Pinctada imbricata]